MFLHGDTNLPCPCHVKERFAVDKVNGMVDHETVGENQPIVLPIAKPGPFKVGTEDGRVLRVACIARSRSEKAMHLAEPWLGSEVVARHLLLPGGCPVAPPRNHKAPRKRR